MSIPIKTASKGEYLIDAIVDPNVPTPDMVRAHLRHLLLACELGDLVVVQCINKASKTPAYMLCAHVMTVNKVCKLLPICELENNNDLPARMRPPAVLPETVFVKPAYTGTYAVEVLSNEEGEKWLQQHLAEGESVH